MVPMRKENIGLVLALGMAVVSQPAWSVGPTETDRRDSEGMISMTKPAQTPLHSGMSASRDDVVRLFGHIEDEAVAEILALMPTIAELEEAQAWFTGQGDALARAGHPQTPRIAAILDIVAEEEDDDEPPK